MHITASAGTPSPHPFGSGHGVVLRGGVQVERQMHGPLFSLPHVAPRRSVPVGQTSISGFGAHSDAAHSRNETDPSGSGSLQPHVPAELGLQEGLSERDDGGTSPHACASHGAVKPSDT